MTKEEFEKNLKEVDKLIKYLSYHSWIVGLEPDDIAQEIRKKLWVKKNKFNPKKGSFKNWAYTVIKNLKVNLYRDSQRKKRKVISYVEELKENI